MEFIINYGPKGTKMHVSECMRLLVARGRFRHEETFKPECGWPESNRYGDIVHQQIEGTLQFSASEGCLQLTEAQISPNCMEMRYPNVFRLIPTDWETIRILDK